jgi:hypothetical protein
MCGLSGKVTLIVGVEQRAIKVSGWLWSSESHVVWDEYEANDHNFDGIEIRLPECSAAAVERFSRWFRTDHFWDPEDPASAIRTPAPSIQRSSSGLLSD